MKKYLLIPVVLLFAFVANAQFTNSWIDYNKTYYKFKVAKDGLYRINQPVLAAAGLSNTPAQNFQLWRNGEQITLYTSIPEGVFGDNDYIEFWGEMNDGKKDKDLYLDTKFQLSDKYSLETDTASYFLTVNAGVNFRYVLNPNPVQGNVLPAELYFMRKVEMNYKNKINPGYAEVIGEYVYSSSYDKGESWSSNDVYPAPALDLKEDFTNLNVYAAGPPNSVTFTISAAGNALNTRAVVAKFFNKIVLQKQMDAFNFIKDTVSGLPLTLFENNNNLPVFINGNSLEGTDRIIVAAISVTYPATFNFNNESNFYFELEASNEDKYLVIENFNNNGQPPTLFDFTNKRKYVGDISIPGKVRFVLPASVNEARKFMLVSQDAANITKITTLTNKAFINYSNPANQGDYLIISNSALFNNGNNINNVDLYRQYRSSQAGGNYNAKVINISELNEQFGFGIKNHPASVRDFIRFAKANFNIAPKYVFLIGRGLSYLDYKANENNPIADKLNLVPTFGWPASDNLLSCNPATFVPLVPIGRLGAINGNEVGIYLEKIKQYEQAQQSTSQTIADKGWMKNFMHIVGGKTEQENADFTFYTNGYKTIAADTFYGAHVESFAKSEVGPIEQKSNQKITELFNEGLSFIQYFGHSSAQAFAFNLNNPNDYSNVGKYPFFNVSGCTAGNFFVFDPARLNDNMTLSEKYILSNQKGSIGFLASTHFGIPPYLNIYNTNFYKNISKTMYGNTVGNQIKQVLQTLGSNPQNLNFYVRMNLEENTLHGDPALKINSFAKPDYVIEDQSVKIDPNPVSIAENNFKIAIKMFNIGKATTDSIRITVKQKLPNNTNRVLFDKKRLAMPYIDSINIVAQINPLTDKGLNKLIITLDEGNLVDELSEMNNVLEKEFYIFEDELKTLYPYNYSIINQQNITFSTSTANPLGGQRDYVMEMDTTELFNSPLKKTYNANGKGGVIQFKPANITYTDSTVYYWRVAIVPLNNDEYKWNSSSFIYLQSGTKGFNQSHYYQYTKNTYHEIALNNSRVFEYTPKQVNFIVRSAIFPFGGQTAEYSLQNGGFVEQAGFYSPLANNSNVLRFYIIDSITIKAWKNIDQGLTGLYGSYKPTPINQTVLPGFFQFDISTLAARQTIMNFLDLIPSGNHIAVTNTPGNTCTFFPSDWQNDTMVLGQNISLYHKLKSLGFTYIDSLKTHLPFIFVTKKGTNEPVSQIFGLNQSDKIETQFLVQGRNLSGDMESDKLGPAKKWKELHWRGMSIENPTNDSVAIEVIGLTLNGLSNKLATVRPAIDTTLDWIDASLYPYLKLKMINTDSLTGTPHQLKYWQITADYLPEGAVAPNILFALKDTVEQGEPIIFKLAFKNISPQAFADSIKVNFIITDRNNVPTPLNIPKQKALLSGDTLVVSYQIDTKKFPGANTLFVDVNPNNDQPEQFHFNNILYKSFYVKPDNYNPLLDITFDGVHILNKDIVAASPQILIKLKDESKFLALTDTALLKVQIRYPDDKLHDFKLGDNMQFIPANLGTGENTASINLTPHFVEDGEYELIVSGKDIVGNSAGNIEYRVSFTVISKPQISNLLNYPNPFTTSTAFVFTITGKEVPQNMRIQILTITGKVVREITKNELGQLHVGRNITEFKWDGTDTYGQKLANGVYLYRVLTNLNGKALGKYRSSGDKTDQYFNNGYGKMVIIR
jgi:hypothetical protein